MEIRTRIAPSPTGDPHLGTLYIALFNYVFAKKYRGKFILRIEDTDQIRSSKEYEKNIIKALRWGKISWDEGPDISGEYGPYRQSERLDIYKKYAQKLLDTKKAYKCFATKEELEEMRTLSHGYDRRYRNLSEKEIEKLEKENKPYVIRLKVPLEGECSFQDKIKGMISIPYKEIDDQILIKSDGYPTYHFANVVDDHLMKISHIIRGDEWISSTPKHLLLYEAFGWEPPIFMHMPLLLGEGGKKLSKRRNPTSIFFFKDSGFLPDALLNFLSLMGYSSEKEIHSLKELIEDFDEKHFGKSGAFFDIKKLEWLNQKYIIEKLKEEDLLEELKKLFLNDSFLNKVLPLAHTRIKTFGDFFDLCDFLFKNHITYKEELFPLKKIDKETIIKILKDFISILDENDDWSSSSIEKASHQLSEKFHVNHKKIIMPILFASIMGKKFGPPLFASSDILKKDKIRFRLIQTIQFLGGKL